MPEFPPLPGTPVTQAATLAQWASEHPDLGISDAGLDLWDAVYNYDAAWWEAEGSACLARANAWTLSNQTSVAFQCRTWGEGVDRALARLLNAIEDADPGASEVIASAGEGASAQVAQTRENWRQFSLGARSSANRAGLVAAVVAAVVLWRVTA